MTKCFFEYDNQDWNNYRSQLEALGMNTTCLEHHVRTDMLVYNHNGICDLVFNCPECLSFDAAQNFGYVKIE